MVHQRFNARIRRFDQMKRGATDLRHIVRRNTRRHTYRNPLRAIGEQVWKASRQNHRLFILLIIGRFEIDGILIEAFKEQHARRCHFRFGIAHGGGTIAVNIAEITLSFDERVAGRKILTKLDQRVIDGLIAMRMELPHDVPDDASGLFVRPFRI